MSTRTLMVAGMAGLLALTAALAYWLGARARAPAVASVAPSSSERTVMYWYDPMAPAQHFDKPGKSPFMDMQLLPKYATNDGRRAVAVSAATRQSLGLRTTPVEVGLLRWKVDVPGTIAWDQRTSHEISARVDGVVERLFVRAPYEPVKAGDALAELIAPAWNAAAGEYLALAEADSADAKSLRAAARERLRTLGMDETQIRGLHARRPGIVLRAPVDGVVENLAVREGQRVQAGMSLMRVNGLDTVWADAAIPQDRTAGIGAGTAVEARVGAFPGEIFEGAVESLLPAIDPVTRTQAARVVFDNPGHRLVPGMFVDLQLAGTSPQAQPLVPDSAVVSSGGLDRVIVASGEDRFRPVAVVAGRTAQGMTEILQGLAGDERVVVSGQFLIDSEASLSGALDRLSSPDSAVQDHSQHAGMEAMQGAGEPEPDPVEPDSPGPRR